MAHGSSIQSIIVGKGRQGSRNLRLHLTLHPQPGMRERWMLVFLSLLVSSEAAYGRLLPTFTIGLPTSIKPA